MCPACIASAALTAGAVITTGGLSALAGKMFHKKQGAKTSNSDNSKEKEK
jgi:hypothetical protein